MMRVGYYKNELINIDCSDVRDAAELYADEHHQIDEASDMEFDLFVEDDEGKLFKVSMGTEYDPSYHIEKCELI